MLSASSKQEVLLLPLVQVNFNIRLKKVGENLAALIDLQVEWFLEGILLGLIIHTN